MGTITSPLTAQERHEADFAPANRWTIDDGREYAVISDLEKLDPFFLGIVSPGDHWFFCSSNGALSAGRQSPETALFPYYTVDKIIDNWNTTGPWTAIVSDGKLWNPFRPSIALLSPTSRRLMKSLLGDEVVFDEVHKELGLRFTYRWQLSNKYGFVRKARLTNEGNESRSLRMVDGLDNIVPPGVESRMQLQYSCLADAYKMSALHCGGTLMVHRLAAGITDEPIPLESLRATTVWVQGLGDGPTYMVRRDAEEFLRGNDPKETPCIRGRRGAMLLAREIALAAGETVEWTMAADIEQTQAQVGALKKACWNPDELLRDLESDIQSGHQRLRDIVATADGFQETADRDTALYHYQNTLCNVLRGGVPDHGYSFNRAQFLAYLDIHNKEIKEKHSKWLNTLSETLNRSELLQQIESLGDHDLLRLAEEYLPLILSRRHGDPSRPWNKFFIRAEDKSGQEPHHFEGNWRDIFQNWEALAWSYPEYLSGFISKFLNASTIDGYNPYRVTSEGIDWEVPDPEDPWASIGYWGDHQIIYLLKFLELESRVRPAGLAAYLDLPHYVYADVPYRLRGWEATLADPRDTVDFDRERHLDLLRRKEQIGSDGFLLRCEGNNLCRATLAEKLLIPAAIKLTNLIPGGGIWMNTQRPEWNDANNALAGCGLSVVTAAYLYRYLGFMEKFIGAHQGEDLTLSPAFSDLIEILGDLFSDERWLHLNDLSDKDRFALTETAGRAAECYREAVYHSGPGISRPLDRSIVQSFLSNARKVLRVTLQHNRREDGLWHSYNILDIDRLKNEFGINHLSVMLEGQVAILSAKILEPAEAAELLDALATSELCSKRHPTYLLYPEIDLPGFLDKNKVPDDAVDTIPTLVKMIERGDDSIVFRDPNSGYRFQPEYTNHYALLEKLDELSKDPTLSESIANDRLAIENLYESVFNHLLFTGRSGSMFGYEGLGSVYWHMVSKLMLAVQEVTLQAIETGAESRDVDKLRAAYFSVQRGLGYRQSPEQYGAFPAEPYSHSPGHAGAQQPGLTGQVKEGILCRLGELGVDFENGRLRFQPRILRDAEFAGLSAGPEHEELAKGMITFTIARTRIVYNRKEGLDQAQAIVHYQDGTSNKAPGAILDAEATADITQQSGRIREVVVEIPAHWLVS